MLIGEDLFKTLFYKLGCVKENKKGIPADFEKSITSLIWNLAQDSMVLVNKSRLHLGPYIKYDRIFLAFFDPLLPSDCKIMSLLLNSGHNCYLYCLQFANPPSP